MLHHFFYVVNFLLFCGEELELAEMQPIEVAIVCFLLYQNSIFLLHSSPLFWKKQPSFRISCRRSFLICGCIGKRSATNYGLVFFLEFVVRSIKYPPKVKELQSLVRQDIKVDELHGDVVEQGDIWWNCCVDQLTMSCDLHDVYHSPEMIDWTLPSYVPYKAGKCHRLHRVLHFNSRLSKVEFIIIWELQWHSSVEYLRNVWHLEIMTREILGLDEVDLQLIFCLSRWDVIRVLEMHLYLHISLTKGDYFEGLNSHFGLVLQGSRDTDYPHNFF